jgi:hypothetical protein
MVAPVFEFAIWKWDKDDAGLAGCDGTAASDGTS